MILGTECKDIEIIEGPDKFGLVRIQYKGKGGQKVEKMWIEPQKIGVKTMGWMCLQLVVYRDYIESTGTWRLFWEDVKDQRCGFHDESTVMGNPFFHTMREAIADGKRRYGITAIRVEF